MDTRDQIDAGEFKAFLRDLVDSGQLRNPAIRVARQVIERGSDSLSDKQRDIFEHQVLDIFVYDCRQCGVSPPWSERIYMRSNGGLCDTCSCRTQVLPTG